MRCFHPVQKSGQLERANLEDANLWGASFHPVQKSGQLEP